VGEQPGQDRLTFEEPRAIEEAAASGAVESLKVLLGRQKLPAHITGKRYAAPAREPRERGRALADLVVENRLRRRARTQAARPSAEKPYPRIHARTHARDDPSGAGTRDEPRTGCGNLGSIVAHLATPARAAEKGAETWLPAPAQGPLPLGNRGA
jgi:hypothetical protein